MRLPKELLEDAMRVTGKGVTRVARARIEREIANRIDAVFADPEVRREQRETARHFSSRITTHPGTEW